MDGLTFQRLLMATFCVICQHERATHLCIGATACIDNVPKQCAELL